MSFIRQFIDRIYGDREQFTVTFAGLDGGGKTTLLYLLKFNEIIHTIPTLGFNLESFRPPTLTKGGTIKESAVEIFGWDVGVGCAGPRYMVNLLKLYLDRTDALVWVVDSSDHERLKESTDMLKEISQVLLGWKSREGDGNGSRIPQLKPILVCVT
jgi:GTPase SAR1 family protein